MHMGAWTKRAATASITAGFGDRDNQLIAMLDSPYVRRVAISLKVLGLGFDLDQVSVFPSF